jgi:hypothetical protein
MAQGGARSRSGPAPDPNALRRDRKSDAAGWTDLPASWDGPVPGWPLMGQSDREAVLWGLFWRKPQALLWDRNGQVFEVALHVRCFVEAEATGAATPLRTLVRQQAEALLLTMPAMLSARVRIAADELVSKRAPIEGAQRVSSRSRLRAVGSGDDGA